MKAAQEECRGASLQDGPMSLQFVFPPTEQRHAGELNWKCVCLSPTACWDMLQPPCDPEQNHLLVKVDGWMDVVKVLLFIICTI